MVGVMYFVVGAVMCGAFFAGWYWLSGALLWYLRRSYPEQARDLPSSLFAGEGWNSTESKLVRTILSNKSVYYYDARMRQFRVVIIAYFVLCVVVGVVYVLYPIFSG